MRFGIGLLGRAVHIYVAVEIVLRGHKRQGNPIRLNLFRFHLQAGKAARSVKCFHTGSQLVAVQRLPFLRCQQRAHYLRVDARDSTELDVADHLALVLGERSETIRVVTLGRVQIVVAGSRRRGILGPRQRRDQRPQGDERCKLVPRWRDWLPQASAFNIPANLGTSAGETCQVLIVHALSSPAAELRRFSPSRCPEARWMWSPYNKQGSLPRSRCSRWISLSGIPAKFSSHPSAPKGRSSLPPRASRSWAAAPQVQRWHRCWPGLGSVTCASLIAITSSPATCNARSCLTRPTPPSPCPKL